MYPQISRIYADFLRKKVKRQITWKHPPTENRFQSAEICVICGSNRRNVVEGDVADGKLTRLEVTPESRRKDVEVCAPFSAP